MSITAVKTSSSLKNSAHIIREIEGTSTSHRHKELHFINALTHKVHTCIEYYSVCPLVIGTLPPPFSPASVPLPPEPKGEGGHTRLRVRGWGSPNSDDWRKGLALCLLCALTPANEPLDRSIFVAI
jgi:hypothetical protein